MYRKFVKRKIWRIPGLVLSGKVNFGVCPICESRTCFVEYDAWLRDHYRCIKCWSIPRQRALVKVLNEEIRGWRFLEIHESSPGGISSDFIREKARDYLPTQYYPEVSTGSIFNGTRCENLEKMTFDDNCFDLIITQDVLEHVLSPEKAFSEIARTLKVGGTHLFTVPFYKGRKTRIRARQKSAGIEYLEEPDYHVNPINSEGALVIREWGDDLFDFIEETSGLQTEIFSFSDKEYGLEGEFLDVFVSRKIR